MTTTSPFGGACQPHLGHPVSRFARSTAVRRAIGIGAAAMLAPLGLGGVASAAPAHHSPAARHGIASVARHSAPAVRIVRSNRAAHAPVGTARQAAASGHSTVSTSRPNTVIDHRVQQVRPAITCTDSWKTATSGLWNTASNWSTGAVPTSSDAACITVAGTYTVTLVNSGAAGTLTLGGASGTQTLVVQGTPGNNSALTLSTATGSDIGANGVFELDSETGGGVAQLEGGSGVTLTNDGTFETANDGSNTDYIEVNLTNDSGATVTIGSSDTRQDEATTTTNAGTFTVAASGSLTLTGTGVFTDSSGTLVDNGNLTLDDSTFNQSGGVESGDTVALFSGSTLNDTSGGGSFDLIDTDDLKGTIPSGQTVSVLGAPGHDAEANMPSNVTNHGTFSLDSQSGGGEAGVYDNGTAGVTLTNDGTFNTVADGTNEDYIEINLTNNGTVNIGSSNTVQDHNTTTTNAGTFTVAASGSLTLTGTGVFTDSSGTLVDNGNLTLDDSTFNQSGGVESGDTVALFSGSTLNDTSGGGTFDLIDTDDLSGTIPSGQTVSVLGAPGHDADAALNAAGVTNNGTFILNAESGGGYADVNGGTMTNNGTFETVSEGSNDDYIEANLTNTASGTVSIGGAITVQDHNTTTTNAGTFTVAASGSLTLTGTGVFTDSSGTLVDNGNLTLNDSTFNQSGGVESGDTVALFSGSTLNDTSGGGTFDLIDTDDLKGTIPSGQTVSVLGAPGHDADAALNAAGVTNNGTFILNAESGGGYADVNGGTMTNNGTFETVSEGTYDDYIEANLVNSTTGTVSIGTNKTNQDEATTTTNNGLLSVGDGDALILGNSAAFTQSSTGTFSATVDGSTGSFGITGGTDHLAGTLAINTVGTTTLGHVYNVITAVSVTGTFPTLSFGPHAYIVGYTSTSVTVTVATPFSLTKKTAHLSEDIPNKKIKVAAGTAGSQPGAVYAATINWGDGSSPSSGTVKVTGSTFSVTGSHTYTAVGTYTLTVTVSDQLGTTETLTTSKAIVALPPTPTVTSVSPLVGVQGKSVTLTVNGTEFTTNSVPTFSNPGISVTSTTWNTTSKLTVHIAISATATPGAGNVTVTTPGGAGTCTGCFTVDAKPKITGVHPDPVHGTTTTVTVSGSGFQTGLTVSTTITGATLGAPTGVTATSFTIQITVPAGTSPGTYKITVTNPDGGSVKHNITVT